MYQNTFLWGDVQMATFKCPDCKKDVSEKADACPHCGRTFSEEEKKKLVAQSKAAGCIGAIIVLLIAVYFGWSYFSGGSSEQEQKTIEKDFRSTPAAVDTSSNGRDKIGLQMTPTELMNKMNAFAKQNNAPIPIKTVTKVERTDYSVQDVYTADVSYKDVEMMMVTPLDSKNIISVHIISIPKSSETSLNMAILYAAVIGALHPEMSASQRGELMSYLLQDVQKADAANGIDRSKVVNNIKHNFMFNQTTGFWFIASNASDE